MKKPMGKVKKPLVTLLAGVSAVFCGLSISFSYNTGQYKGRQQMQRECISVVQSRNNQEYHELNYLQEIADSKDYQTPYLMEYLMEKIKVSEGIINTLEDVEKYLGWIDLDRR